MKIIKGPRRSGRTTELLKEADKCRGVVAVSSHGRKIACKEIAKELGLKNVQIATAAELTTWKDGYSRVGDIFIDDLESFIAHITNFGHLRSVVILEEPEQPVEIVQCVQCGNVGQTTGRIWTTEKDFRDKVGKYLEPETVDYLVEYAKMIDCHTYQEKSCYGWMLDLIRLRTKTNAEDLEFYVTTCVICAGGHVAKGDFQGLLESLGK